jgi:hypothetical protein
MELFGKEKSSDTCMKPPPNPSIYQVYGVLLLAYKAWVPHTSSSDAEVVMKVP